jgi:hypothetical protein
MCLFTVKYFIFVKYAILDNKILTDPYCNDTDYIKHVWCPLLSRLTISELRNVVHSVKATDISLLKANHKEQSDLLQLLHMFRCPMNSIGWFFSRKPVHSSKIFKTRNTHLYFSFVQGDVIMSWGSPRMWPVSRGFLLLRGIWSYLRICRRSVLPYIRFCNYPFITITFYTLLTSLFCILILKVLVTRIDIKSLSDLDMRGKLVNFRNCETFKEQAHEGSKSAQ